MPKHLLFQDQARRSLKRVEGRGGTVDIEFAVQTLQLRHAARHPDVLVPNTLRAVHVLHRHGCLSGADREFLSQSWMMLRTVESRLRLMNYAARHDLPEEPGPLARLAWLLDFHIPEELVREVDLLLAENRRRFLRLMQAS